jgi:hypothetical protein
MTETNGELYTVRRGSTPIAPENLTTGASSPGLYYGLTGERAEPVQTARQLPRQRKAPGRAETQPSIGVESRFAHRRWWKTAQNAAAAMQEAASSQDLMRVANAADELDIALGELWKLPSARDINWKTILNHLQGMLRQAFAERRVEQLTREQCAALRMMVDRYLGTSTKSVDDLSEVVSLIDKAGFDPYGAISADPAEGQEPEPQG